MSSLDCQYARQCSGCAWIDRDLALQKQEKLQSIGAHFPAEKVNWIDCGNSGVRDRADLTWDQGKVGLYGFGDQRTVIDLEICQMLSTNLAGWYRDYRKRPPPIRRGSVRLRVSPQGQRGVWLDFANVDVRNLFEERRYLEWLSDQAIVEIGQRRKRLYWIDGKPKLKDAELFGWFETYPYAKEPIALFNTIAGFTQSGFAANRALVGEVIGQVKKTNRSAWTELFAGNGNFSLALAASGFHMQAFENDAHAIAGFRRSTELDHLPIEVIERDLYRPGAMDDIEGSSGWLVDPPRSGLGRILEAIDSKRPPALVYVSCWTESFLRDLEALKALGYSLSEVSGVDQFVHTPHIEWVASLVLEK